jgi:trk system potassium uptake protein TrkH
MNFSIIKNIIGKILILLAALMVLPLIVSFIYQEGITYYLAYIIPIIVLIVLGILLNIKKAKSSKMLVREGMIIVGLSWLMMSLFGCIPFILTKDIPNFFDAFFEMASGFTTTGASIVPNVEVLSHSTLFWRSFSHWIGGMGVLVFILAIIPESKEGSSLHILRAESPGPQVGRLVSKMAASSRILYIIYMVLTLVEFLLLLLGPDTEMNVFHSLIYSLGTAGTGGFSAHADGLASFTAYSQYVISIFMIVFGINFSMFYLLLIKNVKDVYKNTEIKVYIVTVILSVLIICFNIYPQVGNVEETFRLSLFQVASIISTTGYSTCDFNTWPILSKVIILMLICFGACAGSTAGGFKMSRVVILFKSAVAKVKKLVRPRKVEVVYMDSKPLSEATVDSVMGYFVVYVLVFIVCTVLISIYNPNMPNIDLETTITSSLTCLNNVGPGLGSIVGPAGNFSSYSNFSKLVLTLEMIAGRLELFPILLLFSPNMWRKNN